MAAPAQGTTGKGTGKEGEETEACYQLSAKTLVVPMSLHATNRKRLHEALGAALPRGAGECHVVLLLGGRGCTRYDTDHEPVFRQESYFQWTFGVKEPDCLGLVVMEAEGPRAVLLVPRLPAAYATWMGTIHPPEHYAALYATEAAAYTDELEAQLVAIGATHVHVLHGVNTDSGLTTEAAPVPEGPWTVVTDVLHNVMSRLRTIKTPAEVAVMRYVCQLSSAAHRTVMRAAAPGMAEYELESLFQHACYSKGGGRHMAYTCICGSGHNGATLHYGHAAAPNNRILAEGDMCLLDMGCEYHCYGADITCSFPANGRFTDDQRLVYEAVLDAAQSVTAAMAPGVAWVDMHELALRTLAQHLLSAGLLCNGTAQELVDADVMPIFMPHGLGHLLGIDTHDVGGYTPGDPNAHPRPARPGFSSLRTARILEEGMVITVEPGCYFIDHLLDQAEADPAQSQYVVWERVNELRGFGGVRIEDNVLVVEGGAEVLNDVPRSVDDVEAWMAGAM